MKRWFQIDLWKRVLAALLLGLGAGLALRYGMGPESSGDFAKTWIGWLGELFLRMIKMLIIPLARYFGTTAGAGTLGLLMGTLLQPGASLDASTFAEVDTQAIEAKQAAADQAGGIVDRFLRIVPTNPFDALARGDVLQVIFFSILLGVGILMARGKGEGAARFFDSAAEAIMKVTVIVMETAPFGVFALMTVVMADKGFGILSSLGLLTLALYLTCIIHIAITYGGIVKLLLRLPLRPFFRGVTDAQAVAYSTSSSGATLPVTITCVNENLGVDKSVAASVLPLGATINMDGTAIYIGLVALFGAQALDIAVTPGQYLLVAVMATLVSIGAAGIPSAGLILSAAALEQVGISAEQAILVIGFIYPFDRLLDMMRTVTNVTGDAAVATAVGKWEGELDEEVYVAEERF